MLDVDGQKKRFFSESTHTCVGCTRYFFLPFSWTLRGCLILLIFSEFSGGGFSTRYVLALPDFFFLARVGDVFRVIRPADPHRAVSGL